MNNNRNIALGGATVTSLVAAVMLAACGGGSSSAGPSRGSVALGTSSTSSSTPTSTSAATSTASCSAAFVQQAPDRGELGRFIAAGVKNDKEAKKLLGHDAVSLQAAANSFGISVPKSTAALVTSDKKCLSTDGQSVYWQVIGIMSAKGVKVNNKTKVPANWTNSGVKGTSQVVYATAAGITGNRGATSWTWKSDGVTYVAYVMHRCGNWPRSSVPSGFPKGKTDNPVPPPKHVTPPPTGTPPTTHPTTTPPASPPVTPAPKNPSKDPGPRGNVPTSVQGSNPPPAKHPSPPAVPSPTKKYTPPAPPKPTTTPKPSPTTTRSTPPPEPSVNPSPTGTNTTPIPSPTGTDW